MGLDVSWGQVRDVPPEIVDTLDPRQQYIAQGEALAPMLLYALHGNELKDSSIIHFIDNMAVLSCQVPGNSRVVDLGVMSHITAWAVARANIAVWYEHVESAANLADGGSRIGQGDPVAATAGVRLQHVAWPRREDKYMVLEDFRYEIIGKDVHWENIYKGY